MAAPLLLLGAPWWEKAPQSLISSNFQSHGYRVMQLQDCTHTSNHAHGIACPPGPLGHSGSLPTISHSSTEACNAAARCRRRAVAFCSAFTPRTCPALPARMLATDCSCRQPLQFSLFPTPAVFIIYAASTLLPVCPMPQHHRSAPLLCNAPTLSNERPPACPPL
jgi:hypothetical protein